MSEGNTRITLLIAGPRKGGNSQILCEAFEKGAFESGCHVEKFYTSQLAISYCSGCEYCSTHENVCCQKDDMEIVLRSVNEADIVVFGTPVYFYNLSAQLKTVLDRMYCIYRNPPFKKAVLLAAAASRKALVAQRVEAAFDGFVRCLSGVEMAGCMVAQGVEEKGDILDTDYLQAAYLLGKSMGEGSQGT